MKHQDLREQIAQRYLSHLNVQREDHERRVIRNARMMLAMKILVIVAGLVAVFGILPGCVTVKEGFYLSGQASKQLTNGVHYIVAGKDYEKSIRATAEVGVHVPVAKNVTATVGVLHTSIPEISNDRGEERAFLEVEWRPFGSGK